jgi:hypothetical protein
MADNLKIKPLTHSPMKNTYRALLTGAALIFAVVCTAEDYRTAAKVAREREETLTEIFQHIESREKTGLARKEDVSDAKIALLEFKRDLSGAHTEQVRIQSEIVEERKKTLSYLQHKTPSDRLDLLRARERCLKDEQLLLKLQAKDS